MAKRRTVVVSFELETASPVSEIKNTIKDSFLTVSDDDNVCRSAVRQIQVNVIDATKPRKKS